MHSKRKRQLVQFYFIPLGLSPTWKEKQMLTIFETRVIHNMYSLITDFLYQRSVLISMDHQQASQSVKLGGVFLQGIGIVSTPFLISTNDITKCWHQEKVYDMMSPTAYMQIVLMPGQQQKIP